MSILIKGMEMPTDCAMLLKIFPDGRVGVPVHLNWMGTMVVNDAEAVPVPDHGPLVDALKVIESFPEDHIFTNAQAHALMDYVIPESKESE